jgi:P27 family predicted phage terminase small subunit
MIKKKEGRSVPTIEKIRRGTYRKDRDEGKMDIMIPVVKSIPLPSKKLTSEQKEIWMLICSTLKNIGTLQEIGLHLIEIYCNQWLIYKNAEREVMESPTITTENDYGIVTKQNPNSAIMISSFNILDSLEKKFGFTPFSQTRIKSVNGSSNKKSKDDGFNF